MKRFLSKPMAMLLAVVMVLGLFSSGLGSQLKVYAAGTSSDGYTIITTASELDAIRNKLSGKYRLGADIDLSKYSYNSTTWTSKNGWKGIGETEAKAFTGILDGNGYKISGLWSYSRGSNQGLFGWMCGATVKNLTIELAAGNGITGAGERKGALAGDAYKGTTIENVHVVGAGSGSAIAGGANYIAGLVGVVKNSKITSSSVTNVGVEGSSYVAGIAGVIYDGSTVTDSHVSNVKIGAGASYAGGFIGAVYGGSTVKGGNVTTAEVNAGISYAGGFVGAIYEKKSSITDSYTQEISANVKVSYVGGFAGVIYHYSTVKNCYVLYAEAQAKGGRSAGGFVGEIYDYATASRCYAVGIDAKAQNYVGGWTGAIYGLNSVEISCAYGYAATTAGYVVGGFAGYAATTTISNCYSQVDVTSKITGGTGGFVGYFELGTTVYNSYSAGKVTNLKGDSSVYNGAFSGYSSIKFTGTNYYDNQITGSLRAYGSGGIRSGPSSAYPQGYNTATMKTKSTFVGWDFDNIWKIDEGVTYPYFWYMGGAQTDEPTINTITAGARTVTGSGIAGAYIQVTYPNGSMSYAVVGSTGTWVSLVPSSVSLVAGDVVSAVQQHGYKLPSNRVYTTVVGVSKTAPPAINEVTEDDIMVTGTGVPGATVTVTLPGGSTVSATVDSGGAWTANVPSNVELRTGDVVSAVQQETGKEVSDSVSTTVVSITETEADIDIFVENLTTYQDYAKAGDTLLYDIIITNNGSPNSAWESPYVTFELNGSVTLQENSIRVNNRGITSSQYSYDSGANTLTIYLSNIPGGGSVGISFRVTANTDIPNINDLVLNAALGSQITRSIIYQW